MFPVQIQWELMHVVPFAYDEGQVRAMVEEQPPTARIHVDL